MNGDGKTQTTAIASATTHPPTIGKVVRSLRFSLAISYVGVTIASLLLLELIVYSVLATNITSVSDYFQLLLQAKHPAQQYAQTIAQQTLGIALSQQQASVVSHPEKFFTLNEQQVPQNITIIPVITTRLNESKQMSFVLLIAPDGKVLDSSYSQRYPIGSYASQLLPAHAHNIDEALTGNTGSAVEAASTGRIAYVAQPIWKQQRLLGAIYLQVSLSSAGMPDFTHVLPLFLLSLGILLLLVIPLGSLFGVIATRSLVRRLRRLITVTAQFAAGNYSQRISVQREDEVGQLEQQLNRMADQFVESIAQRELLSEQNARLAERTRISRELHDAISQDLFSIRMATGGLISALTKNIIQASALEPYVETIQEAARGMVREMRAFLLELRPLQLEHLAIGAALEELATIYRTRLGIMVTTMISPVHLSKQAEHMLFRIVQEAFTNAARHAGARTVTLCLQVISQMVVCTITDDGKGFSVAEVHHRGLGLQLMEERVTELAGTFELTTTPGEGTQIFIRFPQEIRDD